jgi:formamidase
MQGRFNGDPYCAPICPGCGTEWPDTRIEGIGQEAIRCATCGVDATPFTFTNGYTIAFDELRTVGLTVPKDAAESFAREAARFAALPDRSIQNPVLTFAPHDIVALATRLRPFMGQIGTSPSTAIPDSHNGGDFGSFLIGAPHRYALSAQELQRHKTDGHTDVDAVRAGAILVCPVKLDGGEQDLPFLAKSLSREERLRALELGRRYGVSELEESLPISVIGTGPDLNSATDNGLARAAELLDLSVPEVKNRATIAGAIEIGRHPSVVQVTFRTPVERLQARGLLGYAIEQYGR